jgi:glucose/arabinose dehydrogenase
MVGTAPPPLSTTQGGFARIAPDGSATYVLAGAAANDPLIGRDSHNSAPALSNDETTLYVVVKSATTDAYAYLLGLDTATLARRYSVFLKDPRNTDNANIADLSTSSPTVAPDDDVYFGVLAGPSFLLRFSSDLTVEKAPGAFGWDSTAAIVPRGMVPSYAGTSPYLIFVKYNNYATPGGGSENGVNRIAILDPGSTEVNPRDSSSGVLVMREVLTIVGPTPDAEQPTIPTAVREWCIDTAAVNPATHSVFTPSEDGHLYRWDLVSNSLSQAVQLSPGIGEPYVPTVIGPDGTVYTLNGGTLFALGGVEGVRISLFSSVPDDHTVVAGSALTFTAAVMNAGPGGVPTGTVTFQDTIYFVAGPDDLQGTTTTLCSGVALDPAGHASCDTASLSGGAHFITALYSGDASFSAGSAILVQRVHDHASSTGLASSLNPSGPGQAVTFTATATSVPPGSGTPSGMVIFQEGPDALAQVPLDAGGAASFITSVLSPGAHTITAIYVSDPRFASSDASLTQAVGTATYSIPGFSDTAVVSGLSQPTAFTWTPDGRMLILEKIGRVRIVVDGVLQGTAALDISASVDSGVEKGLLGICLDPGFAINGYVYLYYTNRVPQNRISRFTMSGNTLDPMSESVILDHIDATNGNHNGGHVAIGPDGKLWTAPGDSGTGGAKSQNLAVGSFNGKVLRMELDGSPAAGNPFLADPTKEPRIWAYGFRNPFRFTFRPGNGSLYVADVGEISREELDVVTAGGNYGWPLAEGTLGGCAGCIPPVFEYDHTVGQTIIGGVFVTGAAYPPFLRGKYLFGDYSSSWIRYLDFSASDTLIGTLQNLASSAQGPVHFAAGPDGAIYYAAINAGQIYRINRYSDKIIYRPGASSQWYVKRGDGGPDGSTQWGTTGDVPVPGFYTGDAQQDFAVFRPSSGSWFVKTAAGVIQPSVQWGTSTDSPVPGQYGGDGRTDFAVWRPSNGTWYVKTAEGTELPSVQWGTAGDIPVPGDYDGDGVTDFAVFRPSNVTWYIRFSGGGTASVAFGAPGDIPVGSENTSGTGRADYVIFRPSNGTWYVKSSATLVEQPSRQWGTAGDVPLPSNMSADARADRVVWRPSDGTWYILSAEGLTQTAVPWGTSGDIPRAR